MTCKRRDNSILDEHREKSNYHVTNYKSAVMHMSDDAWITCFCYLNVQDLLSIHKTCAHFNHLTDNTLYPIINKHWKYHCRQLCTNIDNCKYNDKIDCDAFLDCLKKICQNDSPEPG